ncbi:uncharacterized protein PV09_07062 [Verruconis gallopava]|uniref:Enoyl reductase (ER) domain-containing protein n=1 Tax=Verruconis gallopava TaxID=253628 RepID=A0A0D2A524_9PEZI|nr:uncharacterized protein PV09_07062 [Verruconis gallopava]KIW01590.1 hypothetical protein PV09_07062 [Verruconis gallopava]
MSGVTMRAWQYSTRNKPFEANLVLNSIPILKAPASSTSLKDRCILVKVHAASINPADYKVPTTPILGYWINSKPATPGLDYSGVIEEIPNGVKTDLKVGDRVIGRLDWMYQHGSLAEYVLGQPNGMVRLPENVSFEQGAAIGTAGLSALQPMQPYVKPGYNVFINGGSGGVGSFATQIAKLLGAGQVTVTCGPANVGRMKALGADEVLNYRETDIMSSLRTMAKDQGRMYDLIIENVGNNDKLFEESHHFLKPSGRFIQVAGTDLALVIRRAVLPRFLGGGRRKYGFYLTSNDNTDLRRIVTWVAEGKLKVEIDEVFAFEDAKAAYKKLSSGRAQGKIVIKVC